ncbi:MAG: methyltransferase [Candidatus Micrarchaeota archaeon]|nr:methyltransferase [Candidatus Micrarchaeota archaeon]MDE1834131.1 methyltransferase [Candidatus Micrarchaeota archaeon]MDE1859227.1 methyltransferase [Candidatus Micrarchaeota archaeon]
MDMISEGRARVYLSKDVFYNPKMSSLRDISVTFLKAVSAKNKRVLDATAATGVRGIRYALESGAKEVTLLDMNRKAAKMAQKNVKLNKLRLKVINQSLQQFASQHKGSFEFIDYDPFGSPAPNIYDLMRISWDGTILMITATDTAVLCGAHEAACVKIYGSKPLHNELCKEAGIRILLSYTARIASQFNFGIAPLLSISDMHYMRIFIRLDYGAKNAINSVKSTGFGTFCRKCYQFRFKTGIVAQIPEMCENCGSKLEAFGALWLEKLHDNQTVSKMARIKGIPLISLIKEELDTPFFYSVPKITKNLHLPSVSHYKVMEALARKGKKATATQFDANSIKTDADSEEVIGIIRALSK